MKLRHIIGLISMAIGAAACTSELHYEPYQVSGQPEKSPLTLGVYYTTGTLTRVQEYSAFKAGLFTTYKIYVGEALESEVLARIKPRVQRLVKSESPYPDKDMDQVLTLGVDEFIWKDGRAQTLIKAELRGQGGAVLLDRQYNGSGTAELRNITWGTSNIPQYLNKTTRGAIGMAVGSMQSDIKPFLRPPPPAN